MIQLVATTPSHDPPHRATARALTGAPAGAPAGVPTGALTGALTRAPAELVMPAMTARRQNAIDLAQYDGEPPPVAQPVWQIGQRSLPGALVGEQRRLVIPSDEGYGPRGFPAWGIPPQATLVFDLEVLSAKDDAVHGVPRVAHAMMRRLLTGLAR